MARVTQLLAGKATFCNLVDLRHQHQRQLRQQPARLAPAALSVPGPRPRLARRFAIVRVDAQTGRSFTFTAAKPTPAGSSMTSGVGILLRRLGRSWPTCPLLKVISRERTGTERYMPQAASLPACISPRTL